MMHLSDFIIKQGKKILENKQYAIFCTALLSVLPFASWLSVAIVAFITLRKGAKSGFELLMPALVIHSVPLMMLVTVESALVNTVISYIPCYIAAISLRNTAKWQSVAGVFFVLSFIAFMLMQLLAPGFAVDQLAHFKTMIAQYQEYNQFLESTTQGINSFDLAQFFFGLQVLSVLLSSLLSLFFARFIQAKLFVPGGLKTELFDFRGGKVAFLILLGVAIASYHKYPFAINLLPLTLSYFILAGFNLAYVVLTRRWQFKLVALSFLLIMLQPALMLCAYMLVGILDSLFNFRLYLPGRARESI